MINSLQKCELRLSGCLLIQFSMAFTEFVVDVCVQAGHVKGD